MHSVFFVVVAYGIINAKSDPNVEFTLTLSECSPDGSMQIDRGTSTSNSVWLGILNLLKILTVRLPVS